MNGQMQKLFRMFLVSILMLFTFTVNAQEQTITGKVYDVAGEPIIGANVLIQGTTQGVITDMEGAFRLKADPSQSLVISFLGYKDMILSIGTKTNFKIVLENIAQLIGDARLVMLRVYLKNESDYEEARRGLESYGLNIPVSYLRAGVCREELLIEIEGIAID